PNRAADIFDYGQIKDMVFAQVLEHMYEFAYEGKVDSNFDAMEAATLSWRRRRGAALQARAWPAPYPASRPSDRRAAASSLPSLPLLDTSIGPTAGPAVGSGMVMAGRSNRLAKRQFVTRRAVVSNCASVVPRESISGAMQGTVGNTSMRPSAR